MANKARVAFKDESHLGRKAWGRAVVIALAERQDGACGRGRNGGCGERLIRPNAADDGYEGVELDHIVRLKDGGADAEGNLQLLHASCHARKTASEAGN